MHSVRWVLSVIEDCDDKSPPDQGGSRVALNGGSGARGAIPAAKAGCPQRVDSGPYWQDRKARLGCVSATQISCYMASRECNQRSVNCPGTGPSISSPSSSRSWTPGEVSVAGGAVADTATSTGRLMIAVLGGLADVERDLDPNCTAEGRSRAKARGQHMGARRNSRRSRRRKLSGGGPRAKRSRNWRRATMSANRRFRGFRGEPPISECVEGLHAADLVHLCRADRRSFRQPTLTTDRRHRMAGSGGTRDLRRSCASAFLGI